MKDIINMISEICSILGFIISLFIASKLIKNSNSNNENEGEIFQGEGRQTVVKDHSAIGNASIIHNEYNDSVIYGEIDNKPILTQKSYQISTANVIKYRQNISDLASEIVTANNNNIIFSANFVGIDFNENNTSFIGYCIKSLPLKDWRSFIEEDYHLSFKYEKTGTVNGFFIEIKNCFMNKKIFDLKVIPTHNKQTMDVRLKNFENVIDDWKSVDEICIVFFPNKSENAYGTVTISDLKVCVE